MSRLGETKRKAKQLMCKNKKLHQILKQIRIDKNISIKSYAYNLGYNLSTVYAIESGKKTISILLYLRLCGALEIDPLTILKSKKQSGVNVIGFNSAYSFDVKELGANKQLKGEEAKKLHLPLSS